MDLSFGEQVKILLKRYNMTIRELAERVEEETGKKMTRQNMTQRLTRDNFKEQDMRMIAAVLGCNLELTVREVSSDEFVPYQGIKKREVVSFKNAVDDQLTIEDVIAAAGKDVYPDPIEEEIKEIAQEEATSTFAMPSSPEPFVKLEEADEDTVEPAPIPRSSGGTLERRRKRLHDQEEAARKAREEAKLRQQQNEKRDESKIKIVKDDPEDAREIARRALEATHSEMDFRRFGTTGIVQGKAHRDSEEEPATSNEGMMEQEETPALTEIPEVIAEEVEAAPLEEVAEEITSEEAEVDTDEPIIEENEVAADDAAEDISEEDMQSEDASEETESASDAEISDVKDAEEDEEEEIPLSDENRMSPEEIDAILNEGSYRPRELARDETLVDVARRDAEARAALSNTADMGVVPDSFRRTSVGKNESGDINPHTGEEYESNVVRTHPKLTGYIQVYDREEHKWIDMTEWAFLGFQERKKALLGNDYKPPIYLE